MIINKEQSNFIKGIAVILMMFHHLFAYSERWPDNFPISWLWDSFHIEQYIGLFGKYCVPIFLFLSGYGFAVSKTKIASNGEYYLRKIFRFFIAYWLVFFIFVPLSYFLSSYQFVSLEPKLFFLNFFGVVSSYNGEWWFIFPYLLCILITPLLYESRGISVISLVTVSIVIYCISFSVKDNVIHSFLFWQPAYIIGFLIGNGKENVFCSSSKFLAFLGFLIVILFWRIFDWESMPIFVVFLVNFLLKLFDIIKFKLIRMSLVELGRKSLFIWLVHSFFCYHFAQDIVYFFDETLLVFFTLMILSYVVSCILSKVYEFMLSIKFIRGLI